MAAEGREREGIQNTVIKFGHNLYSVAFVMDSVMANDVRRYDVTVKLACNRSHCPIIAFV